MAGYHVAMSKMHTTNGKIFPNNRKILANEDNIKTYYYSINIKLKPILINLV